MQVSDEPGNRDLKAKQAGPHPRSPFLLRGGLAFNKALQSSRAFLAGARNPDVEANGRVITKLLSDAVVGP